jgi:hypothetical protein
MQYQQKSDQKHEGEKGALNLHELRSKSSWRVTVRQTISESEVLRAQRMLGNSYTTCPERVEVSWR